jgi:hypothetical protein
MTKNRSTLKGYFTKGAIPTEANFADLIDSMLNQDDDKIGKLPNDPLRITANGTEENLLNFYRVGDDGNPTWQIKQKPDGSSNPGLSIGDATASRLFIESGTGNIGIGTTAPTAKLEVNGDLKVSGTSAYTGNATFNGNVGIVGNATVKNVFLGDVGHGGGWAGFSHAAAASATSYGFLHSDSGQYALINKRSGGGYIALRIDNADKLVLNDAGNVGIGTPTPSARLEVVGAVMQKLDVIPVTDGDWSSVNGPLSSYFRNKLSGKPAGTHIRIVTDAPWGDWEQIYFEGWVDVQGRIRFGYIRLTEYRFVSPLTAVPR